MRRPYNVESFVDDYGRLGDARRIGPSDDGGVVRCPRAEAEAIVDMEDYFDHIWPFGAAVEITED